MQFSLFQPLHDSNPRPFLKWVGGKTQLIDELLDVISRLPGIGNYHEPFLGSGALFFSMHRRGMLEGKGVYLSDNNQNLIKCYFGVRDFPEEVISILKKHKEKHCEEHYYKTRATVPDTVPEFAARIIYLNKTCFNGLYRENSGGGFNVPMGKYKNPLICDGDNLRMVSPALKTVSIACAPFQNVLTLARKGDLVYFDPPYHPVSATANFTAYNKTAFGEAEQIELAELCKKLDKKKIYFMLSNSHTPFICELYKDFEIGTVQAKRNINSNAGKRGKVNEVLVRNF